MSVVIPVRDDATRLETCLRALDRQTLTDPFEVLVVDNGSRDDPAAVVARHPRARLLSEATPSSYAARNTGVAAARGAILAFTDSDCVPAEDWLERAAARLAAEDGPAFLAGRIEVFARDPGEPNGVELYELAQGFRQDYYAEVLRFGATANVVVARSDFDRAGPFSETLISSGDLEWGQRADARGVRPTYAADVVVSHPARDSIGAISRKARRLLAGQAQLRRLRGERPHGAETLRFLIPPVPTIARSLPKLRPATARSWLRYVPVALAAHYIFFYERLRVTLRRPAT